ncbi:hypothetical protein [Ekhidna sp.]|uniref:hypothetical protein n=1 Tax=Ekhidna sp. TaxID=2608089 RepID=UPI003297F6DA
MKYINSNRQGGVSYRPWAERVKELLDEHELSLPERTQMHEMYNENFTYEEVLLKVQIRTLKYVVMRFYVKHGQGEYEATFKTDQQAKDFFKKFPELRKELIVDAPKYQR